MYNDILHVRQHANQASDLNESIAINNIACRCLLASSAVIKCHLVCKQLKSLLPALNRIAGVRSNLYD